MDPDSPAARSQTGQFTTHGRVEEVSSRILVLDDAAIARAVDAARAVSWMREAVLAAEGGEMSSPARVGAPVGEGRMVFTVGGLRDSWFGYRSYDTLRRDDLARRGDQVVVVQAARTGVVRGIAVGNLLGQLRTGALGGLAVDLLAADDACTLGVIGSGAQAWSQVWAVNAVRDLTQVRVHSRTADSARRFASRVERELGVPCLGVGSPEEAVRGRDLVVLATSSGLPVLRAEWLGPGAHVTTVGPKQVGRAEFGVDLLEWAEVIATDSPTQLHAYDPPALCVGAGHGAQVRSLGMVAGRSAGDHDRPSRNTVYLSAGLAGTEVHLLHRLIETLSAEGSRAR